MEIDMQSYDINTVIRGSGITGFAALPTIDNRETPILTITNGFFQPGVNTEKTLYFRIREQVGITLTSYQPTASIVTVDFRKLDINIIPPL